MTGGEESGEERRIRERRGSERRRVSGTDTAFQNEHLVNAMCKVDICLCLGVSLSACSCVFFVRRRVCMRACVHACVRAYAREGH